MPPPVAPAPIPAVDDLFAEARTLAALLESDARRCQGVKDREEKSDLLAAARTWAAAAAGLAASLRSWVRGVEAAHCRKLDGLVVGLEGPDGATWYVYDGWNWGNIVRTREPESAAVWPDVAAVEAWLRSLSASKGADPKGKPWPAPITLLAGRRLTAHRVRVVVDPEPVAAFQVKTSDLLAPEH